MQSSPVRSATVCKEVDIIRFISTEDALVALQVGQKIKVDIKRQGRPQSVELTLAERDPAMD